MIGLQSEYALLVSSTAFPIAIHLINDRGYKAWLNTQNTWPEAHSFPLGWSFATNRALYIILAFLLPVFFTLGDPCCPRQHWLYSSPLIWGSLQHLRAVRE